MTTAHRPTFYNALGGRNQGGNLLVAQSTKVSARDRPSQLTLKTRQPKAAPLYVHESAAPEEDEKAKREGYRSKLEEREREDQIRKARERSIHGPLESRPATFVNKVPLQLLPDQEENLFPEDSDDEGPAHKQPGGGPAESRYRQKVSREDSDTSGDETDDEEEEEEALIRELAKMKRDREEEEKKKAEEIAKREELEERARVLKANPLLLTDSTSASERLGLKRRWDDDVVFRNQVKDMPKPKKRFINDTVRSDFHRKFMAKYIL